MHTAHATFQTENASKYLQQLCKHFAHKVDVEFDKAAGQVDFKIGQARLEAHPEQLVFHVHATEAEGLNRVKYVLEDHIVRFAFREKLSGLEWSV